MVAARVRCFVIYEPKTRRDANNGEHLNASVRGEPSRTYAFLGASHVDANGREDRKRDRHQKRVRLFVRVCIERFWRWSCAAHEGSNVRMLVGRLA